MKLSSCETVTGKVLKMKVGEVVKIFVAVKVLCFMMTSTVLKLTKILMCPSPKNCSSPSLNSPKDGQPTIKSRKKSNQLVLKERAVAIM